MNHSVKLCGHQQQVNWLKRQSRLTTAPHYGSLSTVWSQDGCKNIPHHGNISVWTQNSCSIAGSDNISYSFDNTGGLEKHFEKLWRECIYLSVGIMMHDSVSDHNSPLSAPTTNHALQIKVLVYSITLCCSENFLKSNWDCLPAFLG